MKTLFEIFLRDQRGAISTDWIILTAALLGTGYAVVSGLGEGPRLPERVSGGGLSGMVLEESLGPGVCRGGIDALRAMHGGKSAESWAGSLSDNALVREVDRLRSYVNRDPAQMTALECEMVRRAGR
ncbi:hypothetical protein [Jannaschia aquimarina]|nr:hypothetical protein [Jannaschia aquimarina]SNT34335.1 hypothetical protein SAMN05421775_11241 [Jannaschia aquimarina]